MSAQIEIRVKAKDTENGGIDLRRLSHLAETFQKLLDKTARVFTGDGGRDNGYEESPSRNQTRLKALPLKQGGLIIPLALVEDQQEPLPNPSTGEKAIEYLFSGGNKIRSDSEITSDTLPIGYDQGVLVLWSLFWDDLNKLNGLDSVDFSYTTSTVSSGLFTYDPVIQHKVTSLITEPSSRKVVVTGKIMRGNFRDDKRSFSLDLDGGGTVLCVYDENLESDVLASIKKDIRVFGKASIHPITGGIKEIYIEGINRLDVTDHPTNNLDINSIGNYLAQKNKKLYELLA